MAIVPNTKRVCVLLGQFSGDTPLLQGISAYSREHGPWHLELRVAAGQIGASVYGYGNFDGMVAAGVHNTEQIMRAVPWPVVSADSAPARANVPSVSIDDRAIGRMAGEYLVSCGYRRFAYYGVQEGIWSYERFAGFRSAISKKQALLVPNTIGGGSQWPSWLQASDPAYASQFVANLIPPTAVFACNDIMARHVANACVARDMHVPGQIAILGVDNDLAFCESDDLTLSSIDRDMQRVGYEAAAMLRQLIAGKKPNHLQLLVRPRGVVARRSTDPAAFEDAEIAAAVRYIRTNACAGIDVPSICRTIPISRRELERRFRAATGHSPGEEIRRVRMDCARELLTTTNLPMSEICIRCGYEYLPSFSSAFHREVGMTPTQYRVKYTGK